MPHRQTAPRRRMIPSTDITSEPDPLADLPPETDKIAAPADVQRGTSASPQASSVLSVPEAQRLLTESHLRMAVATDRQKTARSNVAHALAVFQRLDIANSRFRVTSFVNTSPHPIRKEPTELLGAAQCVRNGVSAARLIASRSTPRMLVAQQAAAQPSAEVLAPQRAAVCSAGLPQHFRAPACHRSRKNNDAENSPRRLADFCM